MSKNTEPTANAEANGNIGNSIKKGIRKVNLEDLVGELSQRGRQPFSNEVLFNAFIAMLNGELNAMIWDDGFVEPELNETEQTRLQAKFRNRATSVLKQVLELNGKEMKVVIQYTKSGEMVIHQNNKA